MSKFVTLHGFSGSGGIKLNFEVVGGTTQPANPTENMIWINTDVEITNYYISATRPTTMIEGSVWITTSTSSSVEFNTIKDDNQIMVYLLGATQMVSGELVSKEIKSYRSAEDGTGGKWIDHVIYLFKNGNQYENITGGWSAPAGGSFQISDVIKIAQSASQGYGTARVQTVKKINISNCSTLRVLVSKLVLSTSAGANTSAATLALLDSSGKIVASKSIFNSATVGTYTNLITELDLSTSGLDGEYHIAVDLTVAAITTNSLTVNISEVVLEA